MKEIMLSNGVVLRGLEIINPEHKIHYLVYKITNKESGKYYIGKHHTEDPCDLYMGSGILIMRAVASHGADKFIKEILFDFETDIEAANKERELVPLDNCFPNNKLSYNLREGGCGGHMNLPSGDKHWLGKLKVTNPEEYEYHKQRIINQLGKYIAETGGYFKGKKRPDHSARMSGENNPMYGKNMRDIMGDERYNEMKRKQAENRKPIPSMTSIKETDPEKYNEWRRKMSEAAKGRKHSEEWKKEQAKRSLGKHWYNDGHRETFSDRCPEGFVKGRLKEHVAIGKPSKGSHWWNNGVIQIHQKECPDGFTPGQLPGTHKPTRGSTGLRWYNNGKQNIMATSCPDGYVPGMLKINISNNSENLTDTEEL